MTTALDSTELQAVSDGAMHVALEDHMGDDLAIVNAARVSLNKRSQLEMHCGFTDDYCGMVYDDQGSQTGVSCKHLLPFEHRLSSRDAGLIQYLMRERHGTPFEMVQFKFRISGPIRVLREWQRHRIGSFNEQSTRYVEMEPHFFIPNPEDVRTQTGKPGHYVMESTSADTATEARRVIQMAASYAWVYYNELLALGVAKEVAAYVLPLGTYSEMIWSVNLRSLFNFLSLRNHPAALREIRHAAMCVEELANTICPVAFAAFVANNRVAP